MFLLGYFLIIVFENNFVNAVSNGSMQEVFSWKQIGFNFDGVKYEKDSIYDKNPHVIHFQDEVEEAEKFFIQYNNVPIGLEVYGSTVFVTVPRRRYGIPSTLNYVDTSSKSPLLKPYPNPECSKELVSVYRPRVDACDRLWMVDTGLLEVPDDRKQLQAPSIVIYDLKTNKKILKYDLKPSDLASPRTSGGLTSITVDVEATSCADAHAYITDLATEGLVVFSLRDKDSWRLQHDSFKHDAEQVNFTVAGYTIPWGDGLFSLALSDIEDDGKRKAFFHPLVSAQEFSIYTEQLKSMRSELQVMTEGTRGPRSQSGSHAYHAGTRTLLFAGVAQDAILCWCVDTPLTDEYVTVVAQDHEKLVYISDLKIVNDEVWVLTNQIPVFVFFMLNPEVPNFYVHKGNVEDLIRGTKCDQSVDERLGEKITLSTSSTTSGPLLGTGLP